MGTIGCTLFAIMLVASQYKLKSQCNAHCLPNRLGGATNGKNSTVRDSDDAPRLMGMTSTKGNGEVDADAYAADARKEEKEKARAKISILEREEVLFRKRRAAHMDEFPGQSRKTKAAGNRNWSIPTTAGKPTLYRGGGMAAKNSALKAVVDKAVRQGKNHSGDSETDIESDTENQNGYIVESNDDASTVRTGTESEDFPNIDSDAAPVIIGSKVHVASLAESPDTLNGSSITAILINPLVFNLRDKGPQPIGALTSTLNLNSGNYDDFVLNTEFIVENRTQVSASVYDTYQNTLHSLSSYANNSTMTTAERAQWDSVALALAAAFVDERGVVVYNNASENIGWYFCGWVDLSQTFVGAAGYFRMCSTLESIGMPSILREPELGLDFLAYANVPLAIGLIAPLVRTGVTDSPHDGKARISKRGNKVARKRMERVRIQKLADGVRQEDSSQYSDYGAAGSATYVTLGPDPPSCTLLLFSLRSPSYPRVAFPEPFSTNACMFPLTDLQFILCSP